MDRLVAIFAPRGRLDYAFKAIALLLFLGAMNWLRDIIEHGPDAEPFWNNFWESAVVGVLPTLLALALVGHLNNLQRNLAKAAITDPLTGLPNRRRFFDAAGDLLPEPGGVLMMLDADHFKAVNDTFGHGTGDQCLIQIARLLQDNLRKDDVVARLGGEEFGLLLVGARLEEARAIGERLVQGVHIDVGPPTDQHLVTLSIGAVRTCGQRDVAYLLSLADKALYDAKAGGRVRVVFAKTDPEPELLTAIRPRQVEASVRAS